MSLNDSLRFQAREALSQYCHQCGPWSDQSKPCATMVVRTWLGVTAGLFVHILLTLQPSHGFLSPSPLSWNFIKHQISFVTEKPHTYPRQATERHVAPSAQSHPCHCPEETLVGPSHWSGRGRGTLPSLRPGLWRSGSFGQ